MTDIYIVFTCAHAGLYGNAPVCNAWQRRGQLECNPATTAQLCVGLKVCAAFISEAACFYAEKPRGRGIFGTVCFHIIRNLETMHD